MDQQDDIARLRAIIADYERKSRKTRWLVQQLFGKIRSFPRDLAARLRNSRRKKRERKAFAQVMATGRPAQPVIAAQTPATLPQETPRAPFFHIYPERHRDFLTTLERDEPSRIALGRMEQFCGGAEMVALVAAAAAIEPEVGSLSGYEASYLSPWHDGDYAAYRAVLQRLPEGPFDAVVLVPFGKLGGADLVAGVLADALAARGRTLILRTDLPDWDRPDWYPAEAVSLDISAEFATLQNRPRALYLLLQHIGAPRVFNVNSRLGFDMLVDYGARLAVSARLHAYYFCADRDLAGNEAGYPVWYFANILPHLSAAMFDTVDLARTLTDRFVLPADLLPRMRTIYTPARQPVRPVPLAEEQIARRAGRTQPRILWAGRLDRQKRFDLVLALARAMPDVQFDCWGKAVLDAPPDLSALPANLAMHAPFADYDDLPLAEADGWLYTSDWDGLPTILIELGAMGMPIVASAVGGVPELIDGTTGWPVLPAEGIEGYERALRQMLADDDGRRARAEALQARVAERHAPETYRRAIAELIQ